jgi:hypothetical protein
MGQVIDMTTRLPIEENDRAWRFSILDDRCPPQSDLVFDLERLPNRMVRVAAIVPGEFMELLVNTWHDALLASKKAKPKAPRRRAAK